MTWSVEYSWVMAIWTQFLLTFLVHNIYHLKINKEKEECLWILCKYILHRRCLFWWCVTVKMYRKSLNLFSTWILFFQNNMTDIPVTVLPVISSRLPMKGKMNFTERSCVSIQCIEMARQVTVSAKSCPPTAAGRLSCLTWPCLRTGACLTVFGLSLRVSTKCHQCWQWAELSRALSQPGTAPY